MKKELLLINKYGNRNKLIIQALDGLFLIDLSKIDEGRITPVNEVPEGMDIEVIDFNIDNILVCGGINSTPVFIVDDVIELRHISYCKKGFSILILNTNV